MEKSCLEHKKDWTIIYSTKQNSSLNIKDHFRKEGAQQTRSVFFSGHKQRGSVLIYTI